MTTTDFDVAVDQALLISYDWEPACQSRNCQVGHPTATHIQFFFRPPLPCDCHPTSQLICGDCVVRIALFPDVFYWKCGGCGIPYRGWQSDWFRIEPLP